MTNHASSPLFSMEAVAILAAMSPSKQPGPNDVYLAYCADSKFWLCKKPRAGHPNVARNEWICSGLLKLLRFSSLPFGVISWKQDLYFGSPFLQDGTVYKGPLGHDSPEFLICSNANTVLYEAVVFDAWVLNPDRHHNNLLIARQFGDWRAYLIDHDRALCHTHRTARNLRALGRDYVDGWDPDDTAWLREDERGTWLRGLTDWALLMETAKRITSLPDSEIVAVLDALPFAWEDPEERHALEYFLLMRRDHIADILEARRSRFLGLEEAP